MLPIDPEYVATMLEDDFDPHLLTALSSNLITQEEFDDYKAGKPTENSKSARKKGKATNYSSVYGIGAEGLARDLGIPVPQAKVLIDGYWCLNWSVKRIAEEQVVFDFSYIIPHNGEEIKQKWLINPVNGICYECRKDSDRFSTLCQGTGSFFFDCWVDNTWTLMEEAGYEPVLSGAFHDEQAFPVRKGKEEEFKTIIDNALEMVNNKYKLRRKLGCDAQFGQTYADIH